MRVLRQALWDTGRKVGGYKAGFWELTQEWLKSGEDMCSFAAAPIKIRMMSRATLQEPLN